MTIDENKIQGHIGQSFAVLKEAGVTKMVFIDSGAFVSNEDYYADIFLGKCDSCGPYKDFFKDFSYDKVLVIGLGLGLLPQALISEGCSVVDVIEINEELVAWTGASGHLDPSINIILGDGYVYETDAEYDLIIVDTIWEEAEMPIELKEVVIENYNPRNLAQGGRVYFPVLQAMVEKVV